MNELTCLFLTTAEEDFFRDGETHAEHIFVGCYITHKMHRTLVLQGEPEATGGPLHHIRIRVVFFREAVAMHCGKVLVAGKLLGQQTSESIQEVQSQRRQVHHDVHLGLSLQQHRQLLLHGPLDEGSAVQVKGADFLLHLVELAVVLQPLVGFWVQIVGQNIGSGAGSRDGERSDAGEHIEHSVPAFHELHHALVLGAQPGIPVDT